MASNGIGMGLAATFVLLCSNIVISALRKVIPDQSVFPAHITCHSPACVRWFRCWSRPSCPPGLRSGRVPALIVVNCIILGRAEMFASKNGVIDSALDGIGMGIGFTITLTIMGTIREVLAPAPGCPVWTA